MTNATLRGKPDAGNPHVRFDEGEVASAKPRRGSLLYNTKKTTVLVALCAAVVGLACPAKPSFYLPPRLYAAPDQEINVYFKDVFDSVVPQNFSFQCYSKKGRSELTRWCWTPKAEDAGTAVELVVNAWNDEGLAAAVTTQVEVAAAPADPKRTVRLALFADSLTNGRYQDRILDDMRTAGFENYTPIGSRKPIDGKGAAHDGFGGYTCRAFLTHYKVSDEEMEHIQDAAEREQLKALGVPVKIIHDWQRNLLRSPLVQFRDGQKVVDVPAWLQKVSDGVPPDVVVIELGVNDVFSYRGEAEELRARMRQQLMPTYRTFIDTLKPHMPKARFALCTQPVGASQDAFATNYGSGWNEVQHRKIIFALNRELAAFAEEAGIDLIPVGNAVDPFYGFCHQPVQVNAVSKVKVDRGTNAVHLSADGGLQMGDAIAAWLRCRWNGL